MGTAYTPGLTVSARTRVEKLRRLPLKGDVLVREGDAVTADTVVARTELPGPMQTVRLAERLGIEPAAVPAALCVQVGDQVQAGDLLAETQGLFGRFFRGELRSPVSGRVELISSTTGHLGVRVAPTPVERDAYIQGVVTRVLPHEGVVVTCEGALVQGIFGVGGERRGEIAVVTETPRQPIDEHAISDAHRGKILVGGSGITPSALRRAAEVGVAGLVCGGIVDRDLMDYLASALNQPGYDIGVAITGQEPIPFTLILTEGFGVIDMAARTFALLRSLEGRFASINGATQIRAGVIRPELIVPLTAGADGLPGIGPETEAGSSQLAVGTPIRVIREPWFGRLGVVTALPSELTQVESETLVRVLQARLDDGAQITVPRANVEIIQT